MKPEITNQRKRKAGLAPFLLVLATICFITCVIGFVMLALPDTQQFKAQLKLQAENAQYPTFLAPGKTDLELPEGMIWVSYFTDAEFKGARYQVPDSLQFEFSLRDANGMEVPVESDTVQRTEVSSDDENRRIAVLLGIAQIPEDGIYTVELTQPENLSNKAVAQVITMTSEEKEKIATVMLYLGLGVCGGAGTVFFGILGLGAVWVNRRFEQASKGLSPDQF